MLALGEAVPACGTRGTSGRVTSSRGSLPRWVWAVVALGVVGVGLYVLRGALTPIFFAFLIAYFLDPLVDRFEARGVPRALGITIVLGLTLLVGALLVLLVVPGVIHEIRVFARELPARAEAIRQVAEPWLAERGVAVPHSFDELRQLVGLGAEQGGAAPSNDAREIASQAGSVLAAVGSWLWGGTSSALAVVSMLLIVPVFAFYLLLDFDRITAGIRDLVPWKYRTFVVEVAREVDQVLGQFVRGQILVMLILAVLYAVAYSIVGVRLAIPIGIVAGLLSFIPYVGGASALVLALLMCALSWQGWGQVAGVVVAYAIIQALEGFVITPRIVGDKVGLSAVWVLVALLIGGELFGFLGVLLAVPVAAVAKIFVVRAVVWYRESRLFREGEPPAIVKELAAVDVPDPAAPMGGVPIAPPEPAKEPEAPPTDEEPGDAAPADEPDALAPDDDDAQPSATDPSTDDEPDDEVNR